MEPLSFPIEIKSTRVVLRKHKLEDAKLMFACIDSDRKRLQEFLLWVDSTKTQSDIEDFIKRSDKQWNEKSTFNFGIYLKESGDFVGNIGVHAISFEHERGEIGYWVRRDCEGKGFISEAVSLLEKTAFQLGFNRIEIRCSSVNKRSVNVPKRLGYCLDGVLQQNLIERGSFRDTIVFSKLKNQNSKNFKTGLLHHIEIYVSDIKKTKEFWTWLLSHFGYEVLSDWGHGVSIKYEDTYIVFVQTEEKYKDIPYHRCSTGLNHLAFHANSKKQIDELTEQLKRRGVKILYEDKHPYAGGKNHYAVFFEDPDRVKVEIVAPC